MTGGSYLSAWKSNRKRKEEEGVGLRDCWAAASLCSGVAQLGCPSPFFVLTFFYFLFLDFFHSLAKIASNEIKPKPKIF
jgi:hypothetical protein